MIFRTACALLLGCSFASVAIAEALSPVGTWKTIDDDTHQARAIVEIDEHDGVLSGRIVKLFRKPDEDQNPHCKKCEGDRHEQPVIGMMIITNMHRDGDVWDGGEILDPEEGKTYRCKLHVGDDGNLEVRGFIGISLLGRTQVWERAAP